MDQESINHPFRMTTLEHSCVKKDEKRCEHNESFIGLIRALMKASEGCPYVGSIKGPANNYALTSDLDTKLLKLLRWPSIELKPNDALGKIPNVKPDAVLKYHNSRLLLEIEKTNRKTIWFDLVKMAMLIGSKAAEYGVLMVPRNYCHTSDIWNLFKDAQTYRDYLIRFLGVRTHLFQRIAIIGYTQQFKNGDSWKDFKKEDRERIRTLAKEQFG